MEKSSPMCKLYLYNRCHLGDSVFNMLFFRHIKDWLIENKIVIIYNTATQYHDQIREFIPCNHVLLNKTYEEVGIELWIGNRQFPYNYYNAFEITRPDKHNRRYDTFLIKFFNFTLQNTFVPFLKTQINNVDDPRIAKINNVSVSRIIYEDTDLLTRYENLPEDCKNIDVLVNNSIPLSGQYRYIEENWNNYIIALSKKYNVICTKRVNNTIKCTLDYNLSIKNIASLSTRVNTIVAINNGVVPALLNVYTMNRVKQFYLFDNDSGTYFCKDGTQFIYMENNDMSKKKDWPLL